MTYSRAVRHLSSSYPESTLKYILRKLRKRGFLLCGTALFQGVPLSITGRGIIFLRNSGSSSNGRKVVSKTANGGSIPSDPTKTSTGGD